VSVQNVFLCPFHWKLSQSGVSLESPGLENIPQVPANRAKVVQNHDARKAVSATLSVLKWSGAVFRPRSSKVKVQKVLLCAFHCKPSPSGVSLESPGLENIPQVPGNGAQVAQNHDARKDVSANLSVLKWSTAIFWPRSSTPSVPSFYLCPFHWKLRPSGVSLESLGLEMIPQVPANREKVAENHDARKAVSATLSVWISSRAIFWPRSSTPSVRSFYFSPFHGKLRPLGISLESKGLENISQVPGSRAKVAQKDDARKAVSATFSVLKWSAAIFRPTSLKPSVRSFYLCPFHWKLRPLGCSVELPGLENIP